MDPGGAGIGYHHACRAQHRQPAQDPEPGIQRLGREIGAARDRDGDDQIQRRGSAAFGRGVFERPADIAARTRIDRRLARRQRQAGPRHRADPDAGAEDEAGTGCALLDPAQNECPMGHVRIVAGILDDAGLGPAFAQHRPLDREARRIALGQADPDLRREAAGQQRLIGGAGGSGGAGAGRPAAAQRAVGFTRHGPGSSSCTESMRPSPPLPTSKTRPASALCRRDGSLLVKAGRAQHSPRHERAYRSAEL